MNAKQIDSVVDALSRTITELRQAKEKLASAEAVNASNLEIKRNLAQRINELQLELAAVQEASAKELKEAKKAHERDKEHFTRFVSSRINSFVPTMQPTHNSRIIVDHRVGDFHAMHYRVYIPPMHTEFVINERELMFEKLHIPFICESVAYKAGAAHGEQLTVTGRAKPATSGRVENRPF